ncbi:MAG: tryptophan-rich sensory protein [Candidatus Pacebacteria bacterium]|nr:tryptophan-rich sensory protein [Candidatus Paceibacterota bacterium]
MKINDIIIVLIVVAVALIGSWLTSGGMNWYNTLILPSITPPGFFIGAVWTIIFILSAISAIIFWNKSERNNRLKWVAALFIFNAFLNVFWSLLFFNQHLISASIIEMIILELTVLALLVLIWPVSKLASALLTPYAVWVVFATYLAYSIWLLN